MNKKLSIFLLLALFSLTACGGPQDKLFEAVKKNELLQAKDAVNKGAKINGLIKKKVSPLHIAAVFNSYKVAKWLIEKGARINAQNEYGSTPLHEAAWYNGDKVAALLIQKGAKLNITTKSGMKPIHSAALRGNLATLKILLAAGAKPNSLEKQFGLTPLHMVVIGKNKDTQVAKVKVIKLLLTKGANPSIKSLKAVQSHPAGVTPYDMAKNLNKPELEILLKASAK